MKKVRLLRPPMALLTTLMRCVSKKGREALAPAVGAVLAAAAHRGVADQHEAGQLGVARGFDLDLAGIDDRAVVAAVRREAAQVDGVGQHLVLDQAGDDELGVHCRAEPVGVHGLLRHVGREELLHSRLAQRLVAQRPPFIEVDEGHALLLGDFGGPGGEVPARASHLHAIGLPALADHRRRDDGRGARCADLGDVAAQVGAVGVDRFGLAGQQVVDVFLLWPGAAQHAAGTAVVVDGAGVVVAELHDDPVTLFDEGLGAIPVAAAAVGAAGQAAHGAVDDIDLVQVEVGGDGVAPAPLALRAPCPGRRRGRCARSSRR